MSLSIMIASASGIVVVAERRVGSYIHPVLVDAEQFSHFPSGMIFFDGNKKVTVFEAPHNFVALTYTGSGSIDSHQLIEDVQAELPAQRLTIKEYADALLTVYSNDPDRYRLGEGPFTADTSNCIYVIGYSEGSAKALLYQVDLPFNPGPISKGMHPGGILISGVEDHLDAALGILRQREIRKLEKQIAGSRLVGSPTAIQEAKLRLVQSGEIQWSGMSIREMQEYAESIIEHTVVEQTRLNEVPSVGGGTDVIRITRKRGVEVVKYEPYLPVGKRPLADTHYNYVVLSCCDHDVKIQLDFDLRNPLGKSHLRYPADEHFQCPPCGTTHHLAAVREYLQKLLGYHIIVDEKPPY
jgi:hypothetical protein